MKKWLGGIIIGVTLASSVGAYAAGSVTAEDASNVKFVINGQQQSVPDGYTAIMYQGHMYLPTRFIAEKLGAIVNWDQNSQTVTVSSQTYSDPQSQQTISQLQAQNQQLQQQIANLQNELSQLQNQQPPSTSNSNPPTSSGSTSSSTSSTDNQNPNSPFKFEGVNVKTTGGFMPQTTVQGQIHNVSQNNVMAHTVTVTFYDSNNNVTLSGSNTLYMTLQSDEAEPFTINVWGTPPSSTTHYVVRVK